MNGGSDPRRFDVTEDSALRLLWILLPMLVTLALVVWSSRDPGQAGLIAYGVSADPPYFNRSGISWSVLVVVIMGVALTWRFFNRRIQLDDAVLDVRSTFFRRRTPVAQMDLQRAHVVDLKRDPEHGLRHKTYGYSVPGFHSGHYRLRGGGKGFVLVTDVHRVLVIPVADGPTLLLSVAQPQALLDALNKAARRR